MRGFVKRIKQRRVRRRLKMIKGSVVSRHQKLKERIKVLRNMVRRGKQTTNLKPQSLWWQE